MQGLFLAPGMVGEARDYSHPWPQLALPCARSTSARRWHPSPFSPPSVSSLPPLRQAVKGSHLIAATMAAEGYETAPVPGEPRHDIITSVVLRSPKRQVAFCQAVQKACPIGAGARRLLSVSSPSPPTLPHLPPTWPLRCPSNVFLATTKRALGIRTDALLAAPSTAARHAGAYIQPEPAATPGYASDIIFANGTFIEGSTGELSADGPLRPPYVVYCQASSPVVWRGL